MKGPGWVLKVAQDGLLKGPGWALKVAQDGLLKVVQDGLEGPRMGVEGGPGWALNQVVYSFIFG